MIKGVKKTNLTVENVLKRISEYDIFRYYMKGNFKLNVATYSPFRDEEHPSFLIGNKYGTLYFIDFADTSKRGDCFEFVMNLYNISMIETLELIDKDFGLGILPEHDTKEYKRIKSSYKQPEELGKRYSLIQVVTRKFTKEELEYWNQYGQSIDDLRRENVYSLSKVYFNRKLFPLKPTELRFGYLYGSSWKIYRPFGSKKTKWVPNNVPITTLEGKEYVKDCNTAFINKSKKDMMVIKKVFPYSCAVQNEGIACFSDENVKFLKENSEKQILSFDSDVAGVKNSQQITKLFDFDYCNVPKKYLSEDIKDWGDLSAEYGMDVIEEYLKEKGII